jgi:hypothetical protein
MHRKREVPDDLEGMLKLTESKNGRAISNTSGCVLLMWRGRRLNPTRMSSYLRVDVLALLKKLV